LASPRRATAAEQAPEPAVRDYNADRQRGNRPSARRVLFAAIACADPIGIEASELATGCRKVAADVRFIRTAFAFLDQDAKERASRIRITARTRAMLGSP
jgi:hypothetical protein